METALTFSPCQEFEFGDFKIMPVVVDHSAFVAYAFRIEAGGIFPHSRIPQQEIASSD